MINQTQLYRRKYPLRAEYNDLINYALLVNPNMSLARFAALVDEVVREETAEMLFHLEEAQLNGPPENYGG